MNDEKRTTDTAIQGALPVAFTVVFPHGAFALGVEAITDFETKRPQMDKATGLPLWAMNVIDADPEARGKAKSVKVKVAAEVCPTLPDEVAEAMDAARILALAPTA